MLTFLIITIFPAGAFCALLLGRRRIQAIESLLVLFSGILFVFAVMSAWLVAHGAIVRFTEWFSIDALSALLILIIAFVGMNIIFYSSGYLLEEVKNGIVGPTRVWQFYILLSLFLFAMLLAVTTTSPVLMWIAIEATTLSTAFLISFYNKSLATEAAWKYVIINSVALLLGFLGMLLLIASTRHSGAETLLTWDGLRALASGIDPLAAKAAFIFILIGFGTKAGFAPMHTWLPDAHSNAPAPISALLSGVLLNVALFAVLRFRSVVDIVLGTGFSSHLLIGLGLLSVAIVAFTIITQSYYKRLLAYSSIENMGLMAIGVGVGGIGVYGALLHMVYHALAKSLLFMSAGNIFLKFHSAQIKNVVGSLRILPSTSRLFFAGIIIIAGMPPFGIFATKFAILSAAANKSAWIAGALLVLLVLVFAGFLRHAGMIVFGEPDPNIKRGEFSAATRLPLFITLTVLVVLSFYLPGTLRALLASASLFVAQ